MQACLDRVRREDPTAEAPQRPVSLGDLEEEVSMVE
jgi:hypothetical protein